MKMLADDLNKKYFSFYNQQQYTVQQKLSLFAGN
jgi:hypothetical protein